MKNSLLIFVLLIFTISFQSCDEVKNILEDDEKESLNIICFIDFSGSIPKNTLEWYKNCVRDNIIKSMKIKDRIVILPIDYGSSTSSQEILTLDFSQFNYSKPLTPIGQREKSESDLFNKIKDSIILKFDSNYVQTVLNREKFSGGTDIIGALRQSQKYIDNKTFNLVVIFSDMIMETENINLVSSYRKKTDTGKLVDKLDNITLDSTGVIILTGEQPDISVTQAEYTKNFWQKYFDKQKINLLDYNSGGISVLVKIFDSYKR